ncbi:MAG: hypothetical protein IKC67_04910 [Odoribacter sp.]|nr:hypothetical protein [Odoribacter sp.]
MKNYTYILFIAMLFIASSCNKDEVITTDSTPNPDDNHTEIIEPEIPYVSVAGTNTPIIMSIESSKTFVATVAETSLTTTYTWNLDGVWVSDTLTYLFKAKKVGDYELQFIARNRDGADSVNFIVTVIDAAPEGKFYRPKSENSNADWNRVYEYTPAPGQFINETLTGGFSGNETLPQKAIEYAEERLRAGRFVSLGGFGGYIVVGFDHSIDNNDSYDFAIKGNSFSGSSEPGVVWVMQDENGDGEPNDTWYELKGCETGAETTIQNYAVTYYKPSAPNMPVQWSDNLGNSGQIDYLSDYHKQEYYYPNWISTDSYTLYGTRLEARNYDKSGNGTLWIQPEYEWGYADNFSPIDRLTNESNNNAQQNSNHFDIANAIDNSGNAIELKYIDFIKVQCAVNAKSGWTGELSTEVFGLHDFS